MGIEDSLPYYQGSAVCQCKPDESSCISYHLFKIHFQIMRPSTLRYSIWSLFCIFVH